MSTLKTQYQQWLENNPTASISYTDWLETKWATSYSLDLQEKKVWDTVNRLKQAGKFTEPSQEDIENEPTALAFTPYDISEWDVTLMDGLETEEYIMKQSKFKVGDKAIKTKGYKFPCTIVSVFETVQGNVRVVGEMDGYGLLHIFNEDQLEIVK